MINPFDCRGFTSRYLCLQNHHRLSLLCKITLPVTATKLFLRKAFFTTPDDQSFRFCSCLQFLQTSICSPSWGHHASSKFILPHCTYFWEMQALIPVSTPMNARRAETSIQQEAGVLQCFLQFLKQVPTVQIHAAIRYFFSSQHYGGLWQSSF